MCVYAVNLCAQEVRQTEKVSLRIDQALQIHLDLIRDAKKEKNWPKAFRALEEIERFITTNGEEYILPASQEGPPSGGQLPDTGSLYISAREAAYRELGTFPQEGLASWRLAADQALCKALETCKLTLNEAQLEKVVAHYPLSSYSPQAFHLLTTIYLERGDYPRALRACARAQALFPGMDRKLTARFEILRMVLLRAIGGRESKSEVAAFNARFPEMQLTVRGERKPAAVVLSEMLACVQPEDTPLPDVPGGIGAMQWSADLTGETEQGRLLAAAQESQVGAGLRIVPVVAGDRVLICNEGRLTAVDGEAGRVLWSHVEPVTPVSSSIHNMYCRPATNGTVAAASLGSRLLVFNLADGSVQWSVAPVQGEDIARVNLSSPCIAGDTVLVGVAAWGREITCSLFAYELGSGALRWQRRLVTGFPTDTFGLGAQPSPPVVWGGAAYFVTNLGSTLCCDVESGTILWLRTYPGTDTRLKRESIKTGRRWALSPPLVYRGVLTAAPQDSPYMFATDATSGALLWQERRAGLSEFQFLGGASGDFVYAAGTALRAFHYRTGKVAWSARLTAPAAGPAAAVRGMLVVPCGEYAARFAPSTGEALGTFFLPDTSGLGQHLELYKNSLLLARPSRVWRFDSFENSLQRAKAALAKNEKDPEALLSYGNLLWRRGDFSSGIKAIQSSVESLLPGEPLRQEAVEELLQAARTAAGRTAGGARAKYLELAAKHAPASEQPAGLLAAARAYEDAGAPADALRLYREVLANHQARSVTQAGHKLYADDYARICEREVLKKNSALRRKHEEMAVELLAEKPEDAGPWHLFNVVKKFPNSKAAAEAYIEIGEYCLREKLLEAGEYHLSEFLARRPDDPLADQARALLCETYLARNDFVRAKLLLSQLAGSSGEVELGGNTRKVREYVREKLALPGIARQEVGKQLLIPLTRLWRSMPFMAQSSPDILGVSSDGAFLYTLGRYFLDCRSAATGVLLRRFDLSDPTRPFFRRVPSIMLEDGAVILKGKRLLMLSPAGPGPKWGVTLPAPRPVPGTSPRDSVLLGKLPGRLLVLWPHNRLLAFNAQTGSLAWKHESDKRYLGMPVEAGGKLVLVQADGKAVVGLDPQGGKIKFETPLEGRLFAASKLVACGEKVIVVRGSRDLYCLDSHGKVVWSKKLDSFAASAAYLPPDRVAVLPGPGASREVKCFELGTGRAAWKKDVGKDQIMQHAADETGLYIAQRPRFGLTSVIALEPDTGKTRWTWRQPQGGHAVVRQTPSHLLVCVTDLRLSQIFLVDKARGVQDQVVSFDSEMYESSFVGQGRLFVTTGRCAHSFGLVQPAVLREKYLKAVYRLRRGEAVREQLKELAALYGKFQAFKDAAATLAGIVRSDWKLSDAQTRRLIEQAGSFRYGDTRTRTPMIEAFRVDAPVKIDGVLDDGWIPAMGLTRSLGHVFGVDRPEGPGGRWLSKHDLSATFYFGWDKKNFYFAVDVLDSIMRPWDRDEKEFWKGDLLLIGIDTRGDGGPSVRPDDVLLSMGLTLPRRNLTKKEMEEEERHRPKGEYFVKRRDDDSGAVYEASIPWELFNEHGANVDSQNGPSAGHSFGLDLILLDDDTGGGTTKTLNLSRGVLLGKPGSMWIWRGFVPDKFARIRLRERKAPVPRTGPDRNE